MQGLTYKNINQVAWSVKPWVVKHQRSPTPLSSHCEQDLPQKDVGFLCSVNEDTDAVHGRYIHTDETQHSAVIMHNCMTVYLHTNMHHTMELATNSHIHNNMKVNINAMYLK